MALRFLTSGESHGKALLGILEGMPAGLSISAEDIDRELKRRQMGYGRGGRMKIESDHAEILSGVRWGKTLGSPIGIAINNKDWENWREGMSVDPAHGDTIERVTRPRPGHADLPGILKYGHNDIRNVLERSSARETAMRVALGAIAKKMLSEFGISVGSYVLQIGRVKAPGLPPEIHASERGLAHLFAEAEKSDVRCPSAPSSRSMKRVIDRASREGNSLGGAFEIFVAGLPPGLGSHVHWNRRMEGAIAQAVMSIQAIKGVEIGGGFEMAGKFGSEVMDEIFYAAPRSGKKKGDRAGGQRPGFFRKTNYAGGIEGGMSNGMPVIIRAAMKPIPTLRRPLMSVDIRTKKPSRASYERSDICAVPAAAVVGEAMTALVVADLFLEKFGGDSITEIATNHRSYLSHLYA